MASEEMAPAWEAELPPPASAELAYSAQPAPKGVSEEMAEMRAQIRQLEQRLSREAQTWAEQRAALLKELTFKDQTIWNMMNGAAEVGEADEEVKPTAKPKKKPASPAGKKSAAAPGYHHHACVRACIASDVTCVSARASSAICQWQFQNGAGFIA